MRCKLLLSIIAMEACLSCDRATTEADYNVIPLPQSIVLNSTEGFVLDNSVTIVCADSLATLAQTLSGYIVDGTGLNLATSAESNGRSVELVVEPGTTPVEGYRIEVDSERMRISGNDKAGVFHALQTIRKSIPVQNSGNVLFPSVTVDDAPRFAYRGMMLDIARHFQPVEFVKKYLDLLAMHNVNTFHWHLTDDQGWRIEIKKYPELTTVGSQRKQSVIGRNSGEYDGTPHGGFYTQEQIREVVEYARERFITVIPEVDLPGHMLAALTAYPEFGCTGGPYEVAGSWGVFEDVLCVGQDQTFEFLENVFSEIVELFPSEYIHIGGDECPKVRWKSCPRCQAKIKQLGIKPMKDHTPEQQLQSYTMSRMEKFLNTKGRRIIGWDEILEGGLPSGATVMSWRGVEGGIAAAKQGNDAIMVPTSYLYFDYYQTRNIDKEPLAIGGYVPIEKVYGFDPIPDSLSVEHSKHIIGIQANIWTEYIHTPQHVEYMLLPRLAALSEIQWTQPERKDFEGFKKRLLSMVKRYEKMGLNYNKAVLNVYADATSDNGTIVVKLSSFDDSPVHYTLDGTAPTAQSALYVEPIRIDTTTTLKAVVVRAEGLSDPMEQTYSINKATARNIVATAASSGDLVAGAQTLVDGKRGGGIFNDDTWMGYNGKDLVATIDLGAQTEISSVKVGTYIWPMCWIFGVTGLNVSVSDDDSSFREVHKVDYAVVDKSQGMEQVELAVQFAPAKCRYVKIVVGCNKSMPQWHEAPGKPAFIFIDEIVVE